MSTGGRVLTAGETMVLLDPSEDGPIVLGATFRLRIAGAESNFGIALARLGMKVAWVSRLGTDPLGDIVSRCLADEGLDLTWVARDPDAPTGVFFKWRTQGSSRVLYYRRGSAASRMRPSDVPDEAIDAADLVHLTGITMALGHDCAELVVDVARRARARHIPVIFDPNYRPALWPHPAHAAESFRRVHPYVDWYLCGVDEGSMLFSTNSPDALFAAMEEQGLRNAVVRVGSEGALVRVGPQIVAVAPDRLEDVLDEIGAGDGFAAGFAYGLMQGWDPTRCARSGNLIAARALRGTGDWETFPTLDEVEEQMMPEAKGR